MNTGQMMLTAGAVILMGTTIFSVNRSTLNQGTILRQTELGIYAVSLATSVIQKAKSMDYDEKTIAGLVFSLPMPSPTSTLLTSPSLLGRDAGEIQGQDDTFDDFDDYRNYGNTINVPSVDNFYVSSDVYYVNQTAPFARNNTAPTWLKRMDVKVNSTISRKVFEDPSLTNNAGTDTINMSFIFSCYK